MITDEEMQAMMNLSESEGDVEGGPTTPLEDPLPSEPKTEDFWNGEMPQSEEEPAVEAMPEEVVTNAVSDTLSEEDSVSVSDVILNNVDKHIKMTLLNSVVHTVNADADVKNYIVYVNTDKKIPCLYDCEGLYVPKSSVMDANGNYIVTSIEGRRSGFVIKTPNGDLVMTKNFVYDCSITNGKIDTVNQYNRKRKIEFIQTPLVEDYDSASLLVQRVLPKIVKCGKYTTIETLREQVQNSYNTVNDINAMFKIIELRLSIGC